MLTEVAEQYEITGLPAEHEFMHAFQVQQYRVLKPSPFNKAPTHCVSISDCGLDCLPELPAATQKLDISRNKFIAIPLGLDRLKQLTICHNLVERIPEEINDLPCLRILRATHNKITVLPYLKHVRHLELTDNPIKTITTRVRQTKLQFVNFDWIPFLINTIFETSDQHIVDGLCEVIGEAVHDMGEQFVGFDKLFKHRKLANPSTVYCVLKAISRQADFFVEYLLACHPEINYNELHHNNKPLIEQVLAMEYEKGLQLFTSSRDNLKDPSVYLDNLLAACKYGHLEYFQYVVRNGLRRQLILEEEEFICDVIFRNFHQEASVSMLLKILHYCNFNEYNKKVFELPANYSISEIENISQGIIACLSHPMLGTIIDFSEALENNDQREPLLHFAINNKKPALVKLLLQKFRKPFVKNNHGKYAKNMRGSVFSRKLIWKFEKYVIKQQFESQPQPADQVKSKKNTQRWLSIVCSPKNQVATSRKNSHRNLLGSRLQKIQKSFHRKKMIRGLRIAEKSPIKNQVQFPEEEINEDETGITYDFAINMVKSTNKQVSTQRITPESNILVLYELLHRSELNNFQRDYSISRPEPSRHRNSIFSTLNVCRDVETIDSETELVMSSPKYRKSGPEMCWSPCQEVHIDSAEAGS